VGEGGVWGGLGEWGVGGGGGGVSGGGCCRGVGVVLVWGNRASSPISIAIISGCVSYAVEPLLPSGHPPRLGTAESTFRLKGALGKRFRFLGRPVSLFFSSHEAI